MLVWSNWSLRGHLVNFLLEVESTVSKLLLSVLCLLKTSGNADPPPFACCLYVQVFLHRYQVFLWQLRLLFITTNWTSNNCFISCAATFFHISRSLPFFPPSFKAHDPPSGYAYCEELLLIQNFLPHRFVQLIMPTKALYLAVLPVIIKLHTIFKVISYICPVT